MHDSNDERHGKLNVRAWLPRGWRVLRLGRVCVLDWRGAR